MSDKVNATYHGTAPKPRLRDVEARAEAATEGPWGAREAALGHPSNGPDHYRVEGTAGRDAEVITVARSDYDAMGAHDATFIAAARTDVPALTAAIRAVEAVLSHWSHYESLRALRGEIRAALSAHIDLDES